ncbi:hypothetical protein [Methanobrevibacter sp.]|uniref:hypothetical protein n=1 Tax=Methanobrevibacter sp. TaxID=66852 RepID=UPI00388F8B03
MGWFNGLKFDVNITNVTYWGANGVENTGNSTIVPVMSYREAGQNVTLAGVVNGMPVNVSAVTNAEGKIVLDVGSGDYWLSVIHDDDSYYSSAKAVFTNMKIIVIENNVTVNVPSDVTGNVSIIVNNVTYPVSIVNGTGSIKVPSMPSGPVEVVISNDSKYGNISYEVTPFVPVSIDSNKNVNVFYLEPASYSVCVLVDKKPVSGIKVKFTVAGKTYYAPTNAKGIATVKLSLAPGKYTITASYSGKTVKNSVTVKQIISAKKTTNVKKSKKQTFITITVKGHKVKQSVNVKFTYKGKNKIAVSFGKDMKKQKVTVKFKGKKYYVKVNAKGKGTLKLTKKVAKKLKKGKKYTTKVTYKGPKLYKKAKLTVKFNGKKYSVKTNAYGIAKFKVTKNMVKKLKKGKTLGYTITYKKATLKRFVKIK